jgi:CheY-like chemotaxis protein
MGNVLLIDDDPVLCKLYKTRLETDHHRVEVSSDGQQALDILKTFKADVIILDLMMPRVNGFRFLEQVNLDPALKSIPVIVFSSLIRPEQVEYLQKLGVKTTINKIDVTPTQLVATINQTIQSG